MQLLLVLGVVFVTRGRAGEEYQTSPYRFEYNVHDDKQHLDFGHEEQGDGAGSVHGSYQVMLPDGRLQHVSYTVNGQSGYVATVSYDGQAVHPAAYHQGHRIGKSQHNFP